MARKPIKYCILILILVILAVVPNRVDGSSAMVGVRFPAEDGLELNRISVNNEAFIDYGSFFWTVLPRADLVRLEAAGVNFHSFDDPYVLTLGGQSFDPLTSTPIFEMGGEGQYGVSEPGLHLVQFQGPTKGEWLTALEADGLEVIQYIHPFTYVVWGDTVGLNKSEQNSFVRWTGQFLPVYAVQPENRILNTEPILVRVIIYNKISLAETIRAIEALGGQLLGTATEIDPVFNIASFVLPGDQMLAAATLPGVYSVQPVPTEGGDRGELSNQINAGNVDGNGLAFPGYLSWLNSIGLSGGGVIIANVDSGIDQNHPDLINRMLPCSGTTCGSSLTASNHGTHTAGIMAGDGTSGTTASGFLRGLGMAPGANLIEQVYSPTYTYEGGMLTLMTQSYQNNAVISGNSWGPSNTPLGYDIDTRWVDIGVRDADPNTPGNQPLTFVLSIMNGYGGQSTQGTPDEAKNIFTIGSTVMQSSTGSQFPNINDLSANTAHGPALDGRNIPHMVAPGCNVDSTTMNGNYGLICGTSMASPHVSGAAALFYERYRNLYGKNPSPAMVKAAFLAVAHDLSGNRNADGNILGHPFDSKQGWGRMDANAVLNPDMEVLFFDQQVLLTGTGQTWSMDIVTSSPVRLLKAMLVWTDAPGHGNGGYTPAWVNDLDLTISIGDAVFYGNNFGSDGTSIPGVYPDDRNNTEGIFLSNSPAGTYKITVIAANIAGDGVPNVGDNTDQDFALAIYYSVYDFQYNYILPLFLH